MSSASATAKRSGMSPPGYYTYAQTDRQPENIMPVAPSIGWDRGTTMAHIQSHWERAVSISRTQLDTLPETNITDNSLTCNNIFTTALKMEISQMKHSHLHKIAY